MAKGVVATLDTIGWVTEPGLMLNKIYDYWIGARKDQSLILKNIESFQYVRESNQGTKSKEQFISKIKESLSKVIGECFDKITFLAVEEIDPDPKKAMFKVKIICTVEENGTIYDLQKSIELNNRTYELIEQGRRNAK